MLIDFCSEEDNSNDFGEFNSSNQYCFSGFRDFGVGIDTTVYINSFFESAQMLTSLKDFASFESDKGFLALAFLASSFSNDSQSLLLVTAFLYSFSTFVLYGCLKNIIM